MKQLMIMMLLILVAIGLSACDTNLVDNHDHDGDGEQDHAAEDHIDSETMENLEDHKDGEHLDFTGGENTFLQIVGVQNEVDTKSNWVTYHNDVEGYLVRPDDDNSYPGIVMIHEWWGLNENMKQTANVLASEGYTVLVVDLYNGEVAETSDQARELTGSVDQEEAIANMKSAILYMREQEQISKVASMGFCFGGAQSISLSASDADLDATIVYYGRLPEDVSNIDEPVLGIFGELDGGIPPEDVNAFQAKLDEAGLANDITIYNDAGHAFANPDGSRFAEEQTKDAWAKTLVFLAENLN